MIIDALNAYYLLILTMMRGLSLGYRIAAHKDIDIRKQLGITVLKEVVCTIQLYIYICFFARIHYVSELNYVSKSIYDL